MAARAEIYQSPLLPDFHPSVHENELPEEDRLFSVFPGFCDVHVHFREPGFSYKETIRTGSAAALRGGYTAVCAMPNLSPVPDDAKHLALEQALIDRDAMTAVYPYGAITRGEGGMELADLRGMAPRCIAFSDDGHGVQSEDRMREAMQEAAKLNKIIAAHCEDNSLLFGGVINAGPYAETHGLRGICSESEWGPIARDIRLVRETGCAYHVCHVSTRESVELIRYAKAEGLNVTAETAPHYLLLDDTMLEDDGVWKMNPPLRSPSDREAVLEGLLDGTIDMIATDHAPHSAEEKSRGLGKSANGVVGLECAFPVLYTDLVLPGILPLERLIDAMAIAPRRRFGIPMRGWTAWDLDADAVVTPDAFVSMGHATPFGGRRVRAVCAATVCDKGSWKAGHSPVSGGTSL